MNQKQIDIALKVLAILLIPFLIWLGFHREATFVEMNKLIMFKQNPSVGNWASEIVADYYDYSEQALYTAKWWLTVRFSIYFFLLSGLILFLFFRKKKVLYYLLMFYLVIFVLAGISYLSSYITGNHRGAYLVARRLMGLLQSPYPFMLIFVLILFGLDRMKISQKSE